MKKLLTLLLGVFLTSTIFSTVDVKQDVTLNSSMTHDIWYQGLYISSGSGYINQIIAGVYYGSSGVEWVTGDTLATGVSVRINIDGAGFQTLSHSNFTSLEAVFADMQAFTIDGGGHRSRFMRPVFRGIRFESSVDIEYKQDTGISRDGLLIVHYSEDQ